jgi:hypothetical protein
MSELRVDYSRADAERRFKLLEMAKGDLVRAIELENWLWSGLPPGVKAAVIDIRAPVDGTTGRPTRNPVTGFPIYG